MKLKKLAFWTFVGILSVSILVGGVGGTLLLREVEQSYCQIQEEANEKQARNIAALLEQEVATGVKPNETQLRLQQSLSRSGADDANFVCLLSGQGIVLCHPDSRMVGMNMKGMTVERLPDESLIGFQERLTRRLPGATRLQSPNDPSQVQLVYQRPVEGTDWMVSVHSNLRLVTARVKGLRNGILKITIPTLLSFIVLSTLVARLAVRRYEEQIEAINSYLEWRVKGHKKATPNPLIGELHETRRH